MIRKTMFELIKLYIRIVLGQRFNTIIVAYDLPVSMSVDNNLASSIAE